MTTALLVRSNVNVSVGTGAAFGDDGACPALIVVV